MDQSLLLIWGTLIFVAFHAAEYAFGAFRDKTETWRDKVFPMGGFAAHIVLASPLIALALSLVFDHLFPGTNNALADTPFWVAFPLMFLLAETAQYGLHRAAHTWPWLWKLHRTHHTAPKLNIAVVYRYNVFWTLLLPLTWIGTAALHLGLTGPFVLVAFTTMLQGFITHTAFRWDLHLRKVPVLDKALNVVEKIITLPDTHHAHHGLGRHSHMVGNYAVTFFFLDVLFGSAKFPHARQEKFGLPQKFDWWQEMFWPVFGPEAKRRRRAPAASEAAE